MNENFSRPKGRLFAALFRLRVQCIFFPAGEYTYSTLAKRRGEGGKGEDAAGILRRSRRKTVRVACIPFAACEHMRRPSSGAPPIYTRAYPLFIAVKARPQSVFADPRV